MNKHTGMANKSPRKKCNGKIAIEKTFVNLHFSNLSFLKKKTEPKWCFKFDKIVMEVTT